MVNRPIIISGVILIAAGAYRVLLIKPAQGKQSATITRVLVGGYMLIILASVADLVGGPVPQLTGMLLALATMTALYAVLPDLFSRFSARKGA